MKSVATANCEKSADGIVKLKDRMFLDVSPPDTAFWKTENAGEERERVRTGSGDSRRPEHGSVASCNLRISQTTQRRRNGRKRNIHL